MRKTATSRDLFAKLEDELKKKPTTSELLDWLKLLLNEDISPEAIAKSRCLLLPWPDTLWAMATL